MIPALMWNNGEVSQDISRFPKEACTFLLLEKKIKKEKWGLKQEDVVPRPFVTGRMRPAYCLTFVKLRNKERL